MEVLCPVYLAGVLAGRGSTDHVGGDVPAAVGRPVARRVAHRVHSHLQ